MNSKFKKSKQLLYDPFIIPRVKQYLEENVHETYVDVAVMAKQLQERYREYSRRKVGPFRMLVEQAYRTVLHSYGLDSNPSTDDNDGDGSDVEMMETTPSNHLNNTLTDLYSKNTTTQKSENELIDISSDESGNEADKPSSGKADASVKKDAATTLKEFATKLSRNGAKHGESDSSKNVIASFGPHGATIQVAKKRKVDIPNVQPPSGGKTPPGGGGGGGDATSSGYVLATSTSGGRPKKYKKEVKPKKSAYAFHDLGGLERVLKELIELVFHMKHPEIYNHIGACPPRGILLHGPPGCGKTLLAQAIAGQLDVPFIEVPATELIGGVSGESEERIRDVFEQAVANSPCVLFIDEIDAVSSNRMNAQRDMERRIVAQLISSLDALAKEPSGTQVLVLGATNRPEVLDPALRRVGRFDHEISLGIPDRDEREEILNIVCDVLCVDAPMEYSKIAELTPGYVGADLVALSARAASLAIKRAFAKIYRKKQEEAAKNITIVDLDDDSEIAKENANKEVRPATDGEKEEVIAAAQPESGDVTVIAEIETDGPAEESKADDGNAQKPADGEQPASTEAEEKPSEESAEIPTEKKEEVAVGNLESVEEEKKDDGNEKMDTAPVPEATIPIENDQMDDLATAENAVDAVAAVDAIDLDELPDEPAKPKVEELTLFELLSWMEQDSQTLMDSQLDEICITLDDFKEAIKLTVPSAKREGFITVPDVTWDDIGSLRDIREELQLAVLAPVKFPEKMEGLGLTAPSGVLLCGPPGCGKTLLAKAIANEAGINFISVKGPELMNMYVGESERAVRQCFQRARNSQPCVIFFDEFDSLCPKRSDATDGGSATRVVNQLLTEMDGVEARKGVFLMAASNRPDIIDPAVLRPGRLDTVLYVGLPQRKDRIEIIQALTKKGTQPLFGPDVDLEVVADKTDGFTGADLSGLIRQASLLRLKESISGPSAESDDITVHNRHFLQAINLTKPSVSAEDQKIYDKLRRKYAAPRLTPVQE